MDLETLITTVGLLGVFGIVFAETGLLVGFFLPGDSLLFTAGLLASRGFSNIVLLMVGCALAAIIGDQVGYLIGRRAGPALFRRPDSRFFHQKNVERARKYFEEHGSKTIILARFVPVVRTFAPMVAGVAGMDYRRFVTFNVVGGVLWGAGVTLLGYLLGNSIHDIDRWLIPIILLILAISFLPVLREVWKARRAGQRQ